MLNDPEINKLIIYVLAGICAVLAIAVVVLGVKKNEYYIEEVDPSTRKKKKKPAPVEAEPTPVAQEAPLENDATQVVAMTPIDADGSLKAAPVVEEEKDLKDVMALTVTVEVAGRSVDHTINVLPCTMGRESGRSDFVIPESAVSRVHAKLYNDNGRLYIEDLAEHNGTYVNGNKIAPLGKAKLVEGDVIGLGRARITINKILR